MRAATRFALPSALVLALGCASQSKPAAPAPAPAPAPTAAAGRGAAAPAGQGVAQAPAGRGGQPGGAPGAGGPGGGRGGPQLTPEQRAFRRDSITTLRTATLEEVKKTIVGRETEPAGTVFKNVTLLKDTPAGQFLNTMDAYGRALSLNCTGCHVANQWASDSLARKKTARIMIGVVNAINTEQLTKMPPRGPQNQTPRIGCTTCHRGNTQPGNALVP